MRQCVQHVNPHPVLDPAFQDRGGAPRAGGATGAVEAARGGRRARRSSGGSWSGKSGRGCHRTSSERRLIVRSASVSWATGLTGYDPRHVGPARDRVPGAGPRNPARADGGRTGVAAGTPTLAETGIVLQARLGAAADGLLERLLDEANRFSTSARTSAGRISSGRSFGPSYDAWSWTGHRCCGALESGHRLDGREDSGVRLRAITAPRRCARGPTPRPPRRRSRPARCRSRSPRSMSRT